MGCMADYSEEDLRLIKSVREETLKDVLEILKIFKNDSIYSGRIVKFEIKNRLQIKKGLGVKK